MELRIVIILVIVGLIIFFAGFAYGSNFMLKKAISAAEKMVKIELTEEAKEYLKTYIRGSGGIPPVLHNQNLTL